jgi:hypothetical protein
MRSSVKSIKLLNAGEIAAVQLAFVSLAPGWKQVMQLLLMDTLSGMAFQYADLVSVFVEPD